MKNTIQIYENEGHQVEVRLDGEHNTVWLSQAKMVDLFERDQSVISRHVRNVFKEEELEEESNMQKTHIANSDGNKPQQTTNPTNRTATLRKIMHWGSPG